MEEKNQADKEKQFNNVTELSAHTQPHTHTATPTHLVTES